MKSHCPPPMRNWGDAKSKAPGDTVTRPPVPHLTMGRVGAAAPSQARELERGAPALRGGAASPSPARKQLPDIFLSFF